jgi:hypothetical protein
MRIKKFSSRFRQSYRVIAVVMITTSLLGVGYGYWSDVNIIEAQVNVPKIVLGDQRGKGLMRTTAADTVETISIDTSNPEEEIYFDVEINNEAGNESGIPLKCESKDCKIYLVDTVGENADEEGVLLGNIISGEPSIQKRENKFEIKIKIKTAELKTILDTASGTYIKVELDFKQDGLPDGEEGWEYPYKKFYAVNLIEAIEINPEGMLDVGAGISAEVTKPVNEEETQVLNPIENNLQDNSGSKDSSNSQDDNGLQDNNNSQDNNDSQDNSETRDSGDSQNGSSSQDSSLQKE